MELVTGSPGINTADDAVEPISDYWEEYVGQWMPHLHAAGLLCCGRCVHMSHLSMRITEDAQENHSLFRAEYVLKPRQTLEYVPRNMNNGFWPISHLPYVTDPTLLANISLSVRLAIHNSVSCVCYSRATLTKARSLESLYTQHIHEQSGSLHARLLELAVTKKASFGSYILHQHRCGGPR